MKILVTGSMGMVGMAFMTAAKAKGHQVLGIDRKAGVDLNNPDMVNQVISKFMPDFDIVVHLAGTSSTSKSLRNPVPDFSDNVMGTFQILEVCRVMKKPIIHTSSVKVYPSTSGGPRTPYGMTKFIGEVMVEEYMQSFGIPYIINRPGTIYGVNQSASADSGWVAWFVKAAANYEPLTIFGDGHQVRDVLAVEDYANLLVDQAENFIKYQGKTYDVGGGKPNAVSLLELLKFLDYKNYNFGKARLGDADEYIADNLDVNKVNGWQPTIGWQEGIKTIFDAWKAPEDAEVQEKETAAKKDSAS